jgi:hypothetical protein
MGLEFPPPWDRAKLMIDRRPSDAFRPEPARDTCGPDASDINFLGYVIQARTERTSDDWPIALFTREGRKMEIVGGGIGGVDQGSIPGHGGQRAGVGNRIIRYYYGNMRHLDLFSRTIERKRECQIRVEDLNRLFGPGCGGSESFGLASPLGLVAFFQMGVELRGHFVEPLLGRELATSRKALAAIRTAPRDGVSIDLFYND